MANDYFTGKKRQIDAGGAKMLNRDYKDLQWTDREGVSVLECSNGKETTISHDALFFMNLPALKFQCDRLNFGSKKVSLGASMKEIREARKACECAVKTVSIDDFKEKAARGPRLAILWYE